MPASPPWKRNFKKSGGESVPARSLFLDSAFCEQKALPAAGQGILAAQCRADEDTYFLRGFDDAEGRACALAERAFVRTLDGGCTSPVAAHAVLRGGELILRGMDENGDFATLSAPADRAAELGAELGRMMLNGGAR